MVEVVSMLYNVFTVNSVLSARTIYRLVYNKAGLSTLRCSLLYWQSVI